MSAGTPAGPRVGPVLEATGLSLSRGGRAILDGVDLELHRGETVALLGPNGAGKSSLLAMLAGLLTPTAGAVMVHGRVAAGLQAAALADRSVLGNVELALRWWGVPRGERSHRAREALALTGASDLCERPARELSGGEARRVHLARALAVEADLLLLDEPFAGLDTGTRADLLSDSATALRSAARATLVVVHDRAEAWALADRVVVLVAGRIVADGRTSVVLEKPPTAEVAAFLGFSGRIETHGSVLRLRPSDVRICAADGSQGTGPGPGDVPGPGDIQGTVRRRVPVEEGVRLEVDVAGGTVSVLAHNPGPALGELVGLQLLGGVSYPVTGSPSPVLPSA